MKPVIDLTQKINTKSFYWTPAASAAMTKVKQYFTTEPLLQCFDLLKPIYIFTDTLEFAAAAILMQYYQTYLYPIAFWSQKFTVPEKNYQIIEQKLLSIVKGLNHWYHYCEGAQYTIQIYTNHLNLRYFNILEQINSRLACWFL